MQQILTNVSKRFGTLTLAGVLLLAQILGMAVLLPAQASAAVTARKSPTTTLNSGWGVNTPSLLNANDDSFIVHTPGDPSKLQAYSGFGLGVPAGATIDSISVQVIAKTEKPRLNNGVECTLGTEISKNGGATWLDARYMPLTQTKNVPVNNSSTSYHFASGWTANDLSSANFAVRLGVYDSGVGCDDTGKTYVDHVAVWVEYTPSATPTTGTLRVVKYNSNTSGGALHASSFPILLNGSSIGAPSSTTPQNAGGTSTASYNNIPVEAGIAYTVSEPPLPTGYKNDHITCFDITNGIDGPILPQPFTPSIGQNILCNVGNSDIPPASSITIIKDAQPNSLQDFYFSAGGLLDDSFTLDDDAGVDGADDVHNDHIVFEDLAAGVHTFTEYVTEGWDLIAINCSGSNGIDVDLEEYTVSVDLKAGENVVCTFVNEEHYDGPTGSVTIVKNTGETETDDTFTFQLGAKQYQVDGGGQTTIDNLRPGTYSLTELATAGWWLSYINCGESDAWDGWIYESGELVGVTINLAGEDEVSCTFSNEPTLSAGGAKFEDLNANGSWEWEDEPTLPNWTIQLFEDCRIQSRTITEGEYECETELAATTKTDSEGYYQFDNLKPGRAYVICEVQQGGWTQTAPYDQEPYYDEEYDYEITWGAYEGCYHLIADETDLFHFDFGNFQLGTVSGIEFHDLNKNGVQDADEPYLAGWEVSLYKFEEPEGPILFSLLDPTSVFVASTLTDANGFYSFSNLELGDYQVCQTPQAGWTRTFPADGNCQDISITASGQVVTPVNFGNWTPEPQVLGSDTLTNTGASALMGLIAALSIIGVASGAVVSSRQKQN